MLVRVTRLSSLNLGQRIVLVVALGGVLRAIGVYILIRHMPPAGWFNYAPLSATGFGRGLYSPLASMLVVVVLTIVWASASVWLLGLRQPPE